MKDLWDLTDVDNKGGCSSKKRWGSRRRRVLEFLSFNSRLITFCCKAARGCTCFLVDGTRWRLLENKRLWRWHAGYLERRHLNMGLGGGPNKSCEGGGGGSMYSGRNATSNSRAPRDARGRAPRIQGRAGQTGRSPRRWRRRRRPWRWWK